MAAGLWHRLTNGLGLARMLVIVIAVSDMELWRCRLFGLRILFFDGIRVEVLQLLKHLDTVEVTIPSGEVIVDSTDVL